MPKNETETEIAILIQDVAKSQTCVPLISATHGQPSLVTLWHET